MPEIAGVKIKRAVRFPYRRAWTNNEWIMPGAWLEAFRQELAAYCGAQPDNHETYLVELDGFWYHIGEGCSSKFAVTFSDGHAWFNTFEEGEAVRKGEGWTTADSETLRHWL